MEEIVGKEIIDVWVDFHEKWVCFTDSNLVDYVYEAYGADARAHIQEVKAHAGTLGRVYQVFKEEVVQPGDGESPALSTIVYYIHTNQGVNTIKLLVEHGTKGTGGLRYMNPKNT